MGRISDRPPVPSPVPADCRAHTLSETAPAKLNLFLHVIGQRADGYHLLDSLFVFTRRGDVLHYDPDGDFGLSVSGPFAEPLCTAAPEQDNLVIRAARLLAGAAGRRPEGGLHLEKNLPVAAGIGGGSADAAAALRLLNRVWRISMLVDELVKLAAKLGADVPACVQGGPALIRGIGDRITPLPGFPALPVLLVNPLRAVCTQAVFKARTGAFGAPAPKLPTLPTRDGRALLAGLNRTTRNDLTAAARTLIPVISEISAQLAAQPGCVLARMSGSGATCFGVFDTARASERASRHIAQVFPGFWQVKDEIASGS